MGFLEDTSAKQTLESRPLKQLFDAKIYTDLFCQILSMSNHYRDFEILRTEVAETYPLQHFTWDDLYFSLTSLTISNALLSNICDYYWIAIGDHPSPNST